MVGLRILAAVLAASLVVGSASAQAPAPSPAALAVSDVFFIEGLAHARGKGATSPEGVDNSDVLPPASVFPLAEANRQRFVVLLAQGLETRFSPKELHAGAVLLSHPLGRKALERRRDGRARISNVQEERLLRKWAESSPGAAGFARKLKGLKAEHLIDQAQLDELMGPGPTARTASES